MTHEEMKDWIDYVRGLVPTERREAMEAHLQGGCAACRSLVEGLESLSRAVIADEALEPPAHVVRCARALFSQFQPERVRALPRLLARLVQDSLRDPLPAGVRASERCSRQVLYEAGGVFVDLRLEQRPGCRAVALVGQLLHPDGGIAVARIPVVLTAGRDVIATAASNEHGEFHVEYVPVSQVRLHIPIAEGERRIEIRLNSLMPRRGGSSPASPHGRHPSDRRH